jgi:LPXTG-motif cell wall-anchored protein
MASNDTQLFGSEQTCHRGLVYLVHIPAQEGLPAFQHRNLLGVFTDEEAMSTLLIVLLVLLVLGGGGWGYSRRRR